MSIAVYEMNFIESFIIIFGTISFHILHACSRPNSIVTVVLDRAAEHCRLRPGTPWIMDSSGDGSRYRLGQTRPVRRSRGV